MADLHQQEENTVAPEQSKVAEPVSATPEVPPASVTEEVTPVGTAGQPLEDTAPEENKDEKPQPKEITGGTLSKAHGGLLALFKQKRFFYFQDESIPEDKLRTYLHKDTASTSIAAYASQTGKGLLLYSKTEGHKIPHGIIKLADVTDVVPSGSNKFILKLHSNELHLESTAVERDSWVFTLNHKITEAKAIDAEIINSEGYKASFGKLTKPTASSGQEKPSEPEVEDPDPKIESSDTTTAPCNVDEEPTSADQKAEPSRSPSKRNRRTARFPFLEKKKKTEEKKEQGKDKEEAPADGTKPIEPEAVAVEASTDTTIEATETLSAEEAEKPIEPAAVVKHPKRGSIFGTLFEKKEKEVPEMKEDAKSEVPEPCETVTLEPKASDVIAESSTAGKSGAAAASPPKHFFGRLVEKREKGPAVKLPEKETDVKTTEACESPTETQEEPIEPKPAVAGDSPDIDPGIPATSPKDPRRRSFFTFNKKKPEEVKSDSEEAESAQKPGTTTPLPKQGLLTGLMRKASKATKVVKETDAKNVTAPETVGEESAPAPVPLTTDPEATTATDAVVPVSTSDGAPEPA